MKKYVKKGQTCLDFCAGKGGDLKKWERARIAELFFVDHAISLISLGVARYNHMILASNNTEGVFPCTFVAADCFNHQLEDVLPKDVWFDTVSCQFAIHYAFESEERVRAMLQNVSSRLKLGGFFLGTTTDANRLVKRWRSEPLGQHAFGNNLYQVQFCTNNPDQEAKRLDPDSPFGVKYYFNLDDAIDQCPEFLPHMPTFVRIAKEYGLDLVEESNFHEFFVYEHDKRENSKLLHNMRVLNDHRTIPAEEWEIASLYLVYVFRKVRKEPGEPEETRAPPSTKVIKEEDVLVIN